MDALWGTTLPAPAERVTSLADGDRVSANGLTFLALDTPGHAYHHHVFQLDGIAFSGDAAGVHVPGPAFIDLPAPPPEFNLDLWLATIDRLLGHSLEAIYPTHFGRVDDWRRQLTDLAELMKAAAEFIRVRMAKGLDREAILPEYLAWHLDRARAVGMSEPVLARYEAANPHYMSVDGILRYWQKQAKVAG
jgi:glyoxylase-like metal-dependent hydrolase (beta-lactamase superfamily II)